MADIIISSLLVDGTAVPRKVARLHLICDILHNSAATLPSAWKFRQEFQARLGIVFDHLANIYHSFPGRITADLFKKQITTIVDIWEDLIVFSPEFTAELRTRLDGAVIAAQDEATEQSTVLPVAAEPISRFKPSFKANTFQLASDVPENKPSPQDPRVSDGESMDVSSDGGKSNDDLDGEPVEDLDVDGIPIDDIDGEPIDNAGVDDLDGEPIGDDIDGEPVDDDIDGVPLAD